MNQPFSLQLQEVFNDQLAASEAFLSLLRQERDAITKNDLKQLEQLTTEKLAAIDELTKIEIATLNTLQNAGVSESNNDVELLLKQHAASDKEAEQLITLWRKAKTTAKECQSENLVNGQILNACQKQTEQTLDILLGRTTTQLYGASGKTIKENRGTIAKA
jgi:flagellar biosynthesis/type III secretory pathway chaperone